MDQLEIFSDNINEFLIKLTMGIEGFKFRGKQVGTGMFLINYIGMNPCCTMSDVILYLDVIASTATRRIDKLVQLDLVMRSESEIDRRLTVLKLTSEGQKLYDSYLEKKLLGAKLIKNKFSNEEIETFLSVLNFFMETRDTLVKEEMEI